MARHKTRADKNEEKKKSKKKNANTQQNLLKVFESIINGLRYSSETTIQTDIWKDQMNQQNSTNKHGKKNIIGNAVISSGYNGKRALISSIEMASSEKGVSGDTLNGLY